MSLAMIGEHAAFLHKFGSAQSRRTVKRLYCQKQTDILGGINALSPIVIFLSCSLSGEIAVTADPDPYMIANDKEQRGLDH